VHRSLYIKNRASLRVPFCRKYHTYTVPVSFLLYTQSQAMMAYAFLLLCLAAFVGSFISRTTAKEEPLCTSRFDFESRLLERMLVVEFEMSQVKTKVASTLQELEGFAQKIKDEQAAKIKDMTTLGMKLTEDVGELTNTFKETRANLERDFVSLYKDVENKTDAKLQKIQGRSTQFKTYFKRSYRMIGNFIVEKVLLIANIEMNECSKLSYYMTLT